MRQLKSSTRQLKNSWLELRRGARITSQWVKLWKQNEKRNLQRENMRRWTFYWGYRKYKNERELWSPWSLFLCREHRKGEFLHCRQIISSLLYIQLSSSTWSLTPLSTFFNIHQPSFTPPQHWTSFINIQRPLCCQIQCTFFSSCLPGLLKQQLISLKTPSFLKHHTFSHLFYPKIKQESPFNSWS